MKKIITSIIILLIFTTGCQKNNNELDKMSEAIINYHFDYHYKVSNLSQDNSQMLDKFKEKERKQNKIINITKLDVFSDDMKTPEPDSPGVYKKDGNYYIKYSDIDFKKVNDTDYIATLNVNGYMINLSKSNFPILFEETRSINYKYRFMKKENKNNLVKYYYRSYGNGSMLTIEYKIDNKKVSDVNLIYDDYYLLDEVEPTIEKKSNFGYIVFMASLALFLGFIIIKSVKLFSNSKKV